MLVDLLVAVNGQTFTGILMVGTCLWMKMLGMVEVSPKMLYEIVIRVHKAVMLDDCILGASVIG